MIGGIGIPELLIILVIVLLIFGAGKLPMIGGNLGKAIKNFKGGVKDDEKEQELNSAKAEAIEDKPAEEKK
ncbi:MAG: twin-arginine translocase TatA/TatE family subunit [Desulfarculaceae bacterium]|nr:twin-arginine translocase TatA/TatE family subunit [Desulfarculaceae bacterium]MCF8103468.1 twin-arginine translocase TatA/TatE family subunit [Desulfarculaceae bacterium]MCF8117514.1 twin-arginine translocase TatA/TatE family subunit [Desulfarculaceae bacterium]